MMGQPARRSWIAVVALAAMLEGTCAALLCCRLVGSGHETRHEHTHGPTRIGHGGDEHLGRDGGLAGDERRSLAAIDTGDECPTIETSPGRLPGDPDALRVAGAWVAAAAIASLPSDPVASQRGMAALHSLGPPPTGPPVRLRTCSLLI